MVANQIPLVNLDPNDYPMAQFKKTEETPSALQERAEQVWQSLIRGTKTGKA